MIVAGIGDYPRRIRELRTKFGWPIISGLSVMDLRTQAAISNVPTIQLPTTMVPEEYLLVENRQDTHAISRWHLASQIRSKNLSVKEKIWKYLAANPGQRITSEELRYVSKDADDWAFQIRELSKTHKIKSKFHGDPKLPIGIFVLSFGR